MPSARPSLVQPLERRRLLDGLTGQYFNRIDLTEFAAQRLDPTLDFTWAGSPAAGVNADKFAVRWTGQVEAQFSERYTFTTTADDGVRLWVDGRLIVDNWVNQGATDRTGTVALEAGQRYDIRIDFYEFDQGARFRLQWQSPSTPKQVVPSTRLFAAPAGLAATYYDDADFAKPVLERVDAGVDFDWPTGSPAAGVAGSFSIRWTGYVVPEHNETYTFRVTPAAGTPAEAIRLTVDGKRLVDNASVEDDGRIRLEAGKRYPIVLDYAESGSAAGVKLEWFSPSQPLQAIPSSRLFAGANAQVPLRRTTYTNPTLDIDAPDPSIIFADNAYWMVHTMGGPNTGWPLWRSADGVTWNFVKHLLTTSNKPSWLQNDFWAPEIHKVGTQFILTGTGRDSRTGRLSIVMASSASIDGTYAVRSEPIVSDSVQVLDSNLFIDDDGKRYLLWKRDGPSGGTFGSIRIRQLDSSGLNFAAGSSEVVLLDNSNSGWERNLAEAPWLVRRADAYYLFYSGGFIDTSYRVGVARGTSLNAMFQRNPLNPIVGNNATWSGPGHGGFAQDADGTLWHLYHARRTSDPNAGRRQVLDPVIWTASGWPNFAGASVGTVAKPGPDVQALTGAGNLSFSGDIGGTSPNDTFRLVRSGTGYEMLDVYRGTALLSRTPFAQVQSITINSNAGDDVLTLDASFGDVIPGGGLTFIGGAGTNDRVELITPNGSLDTVLHTGGGGLSIGSGVFNSSGVEQWRLSGGTHRVTATLPAATTVEAIGARVTFEANQNIDALQIRPASLVQLATGNRTLVTRSLDFTNGMLDIADGTVIVDYPAGTTSPLAGQIGGMLRWGYDGGTWAGPIGILSTVAAGNLADGATVGSGEMTDLFTTDTATFAGVTVESSSVLIRYTLEGDANLDRTVNFDDLLVLAKNYGQTGRSFAGGDFNYSSDGIVDFDDLLLLAKRYAQSITLAPQASATSATTSTRTRRSTVSEDVIV